MGDLSGMIKGVAGPTGADSGRPKQGVSKRLFGTCKVELF